MVKSENESEIKMENDETVPESKINFLIECRCFVRKIDQSTQTDIDFFPVEDDLSFPLIELTQKLEKPIEFDNKSVSLSSEHYFDPNDQPLCQSFDLNSTEGDFDLVNDNDNKIKKWKSEQERKEDDEDEESPLDDLFFVQTPVEANCTKIKDFDYSCNLCGKSFETTQNFLIHYQIHQQTSTVCEGCGFYCSNIKTFRFHLYKYRKYGDCATAKTITLLEKKLKSMKDDVSSRVRRPNFAERKCNTCGREFKTGIKLQDHLNVHTRARPYICSCGSCFGTHENFYSHLRQFRCPKEGRIVPNYANESLLHFMPEIGRKRGRRKRKAIELQETIEQVEILKKEKNDISEKELLNNEVVLIKFNETLGKKCKKKESIKKSVVPKENHKEERKYNCVECDEIFATAPKLRMHNEREHMERKFSCSECSRKFAKECLLRAHIKLYHIENRKCIECNLTFTRIKFKNHLNVYHKEKVANKKKPKVTNNRMVDISKDDSKYNCSICNFDYYIKSYTKHFENEKHLSIELFWKSENKINRFYCRICDADPDGYEFVGEFLKHKVIFHGWPLRRKLKDFLKSFEEIKPNEECSREIT